MGYARFDDLYDDNPKMKRAWRADPALVGLHAMAITHCSRHNSDGEIHTEWVEEKLDLARYRPAPRAALLSALLDLRLFEPIGEGHYYVHDYLEWNRSRDQRQALAEQGRRGGQAKAKPSLSHGQANAKPRLSEHSSTTETETETETTSKTETPSVEPDRLDELSARYLAMSTHFFDQLRARDPKAKGDPSSKRWVDAARLLHTEDGRTFEEIAAVMRWLPTDDFWPTVVLSMPKFREKFTTLRAKMNRPASSVNGHKKEGPSDMWRSLGLPSLEDQREAVVDATVVEE